MLVDLQFVFNRYATTVICFRDRPQMVELGRSSSEFNIARMRESFLRQFIDQAIDVNLSGGGGSGSDVTSAKDVAGMLTSAAVPEQAKSIPPLMSIAAQPRSMTNTTAKNAGVSDVIRCVYNNLD